MTAPFTEVEEPDDDMLDGCDLDFEAGASDQEPTLVAQFPEPGEPSAARDTGLAGLLRKQGLKVVEISGWQTRGSSNFNPRGSVNHHTAGARSRNSPSLNICINGRKGLPGPLCHVLLGRDNTAYLIAAGRANHAGRGSWRGLSGNSSVYGLEIEHIGYATEPFPKARYDAAVGVHAAFAEAAGFDPARMVCQHREWTSRKIDFVAEHIDPTRFRHDIAARLKSGSQPKPVGTKDLDGATYPKGVPGPVLEKGDEGVRVKELQTLLVSFAKGGKFRSPGAVDGQFGPLTETSLSGFQAVLKTAADGVYGPDTAHKTAAFVRFLSNAKPAKPAPRNEPVLPVKPSAPARPPAPSGPSTSLAELMQIYHQAGLEALEAGNR